jgi:conjugative relaxase-like TrwC/TraI family protein
MGNPKGFGFSGEPTQDAAMALFGGRAGNGERLAPVTKEVGIDFTFSIGKPLSILYALGDEDVRARIDRARTRALERTMAVAARDYMRVRIRNGREEANRFVEAPASWVAIRYEHADNRQGEPFYHDHVHVSTLVQRQDGAFRRLWSKTLFVRGGEVQETLGHRHEAELREAISEEFEGLQWTPVAENGTAHVEQVPEALVDALSTRARRDIDPKVAEWERENGMRATSAVKEMIAKQTRQRKELVAAMTREQVEAVAAHHGFDQFTIQYDILAAPQAKQHAYAPAVEIADVALSAEGLTRMRTTFRLPAVQLAVSRAGVPASKIDAYVEEILSDSRAIRIETNKGVMWTTLELVEKERSIVALLTEPQPEVTVPVVELDVVASVIAEEGVTPNAGQLAAIEAFTTSSRPTILVEANAGTGKTSYVAGLANKVWEREGIPVLGAAPTGKAVTELKAAGVETSRTYASLANHIRQDKKLVELTGGVPGILLTDELTMAHTREAELVLRTAVKEGFPIRGMGHSAQLQSVQAGGWFKQATHQHADELEEALLRLDEVIRQKDETEAKALNELAARTPHKWVEYQQKHGRLRGYGLSAPERHQATLDAVATLMGHDQDHDVLLISPTNQMRKDLNVLAQAEMRRTGRLNGPELGLQTSEGDTIHEGERLLLKRNDRGLGVDNGTRATALGDYFDGLLVQVGERQVLLPKEYVADYVRLGYAVTIHDSQGATADHAIVVTPVKNLDSELAYVAASRAKDTTTVFVLSDPDPQWKNLKTRLRLEGAEPSATTQIEAAEAQRARNPSSQRVAQMPHVAEPATEKVKHEQEPNVDVQQVPSELETPSVGTVGSGDPKLEVADDVAAAPEAAQEPQWRVSAHRATIADIDEKYERATKIHQDISREATEAITRRSEIDQRIQQIERDARDDTQTTKRRHRDELDARQSRRQEELDRLSAERAQLGTPRDPETLWAEYVAFGEQSRRKKARAVEDAAIDEIEMGTPVFENTVGPRPEQRTREREVWNRAALAIGKHRVEHAITDPNDHGIDPRDPKNRALIKHVNKALDELSIYRATVGLELGPEPFKGIGNDESLGMN